jgi:hypothetical protein
LKINISQNSRTMLVTSIYQYYHNSSSLAGARQQEVTQHHRQEAAAAGTRQQEVTQHH